MSHRSLTSLVPAALLAAVLAVPAGASDQFQPTFAAERFIDGLGISAAPYDGYIAEGPGKGYGTNFSEDRFLDLGVRYYRMCLKDAVTKPDTCERVVAAWQKYGVRPMMLVNPHASGTPTELVALIKAYPAGCIALIEMPNELNNKFPPQDLNMKYGGVTDEAAGAAYQRDYYAALKADPATRDIPVICFTAIFTDHRLAKPCDAFDFAAMHSYQGYDVPSSSLEANVAKFNNIYPIGAVTKPFVPTECGYNVELDQANHQGFAGNVRAQALNIPMLFAEYFNHGVARTFLFSLTNVDGYGLLESDQSGKRPSWFAVRNLISELRDATWDPATKQWKGGATSGPGLLFTTPNVPATVHSLTLQKQSGEYDVLLWNEVRTYDQGSHRDLAASSVSTTLRFANLDSASASLLVQDATGAYQTSAVPLAGGACTVPVVPAVSILRITPEKARAGQAIAAAIGLSATATENSAVLHWTMPTGAASAFVYRNDWCIGTVTSGEYSDRSSWLRPGLGYTYAIQTFDRAGNAAAKSTLVVQTAPRFPNLTVTAFGPVNAHIKPGDEVSFRGTVKNTGNGATPYGLPATITFSVDNQVVAWDGVDGPLQPGEERSFTATGGPGHHTWKATPGPHTLRAFADDIDRIPGESDKNDNLSDSTLVVANDAQTGLLEARSAASPGNLDLSAEGTLDWLAWGQGGPDKPERKRGGTLLGALTPVGQGFRAATGGCPVALSWNDGTTTAKRSDSHDGVWGNNVGMGWSLRVPAGTTPRVLSLYGAGIEGASGRFTATLSDGSAPDYVSNTWTGNRGMGNWAAAPGNFNTVFRLRFKAASADQALTVKWEMSDEPNRFRGQLRLQAATLAEDRP